MPADEVDEITGFAVRARRGDTVATALFVRATQRDVWRLCAHLGDREMADDLTQETYLRAFRSLSRFEGRSTARTWLMSIARRVCADYVREQRRRPRIASPSASGAAPDPVDATADPSGHHAVRALVDDLDPERRLAFVLTQVLGYPYAEAAEICGCPVGTIRSRVARARDDLVRAVRAAESGDASTG